MAEEGDLKDADKAPAPQTSFQKALEASLTRSWSEPAVRTDPFFVRWADVLKMAQPTSAAAIVRQCCGGLSPTIGLQRISKIVRELHWPEPQGLNRVNPGVVEAVELMTLVLCERRVREAALDSQAYALNGLPAFPTSSPLAAALVAAAWLNRRVKLTLDDRGQPVALNVLSDLPPIEFGFRGAKEAWSAELVAYLQHTAGGQPDAYRTRRSTDLAELKTWGVPAESDIAALLEVHREDGGPDPMFGLSAQAHPAIDGEVCRWMKNRFGVETFLYAAGAAVPEDDAFRGLQGILLQQIDLILKRIHAGSDADPNSSQEKTMSERSSIFISYSHKDKEEWLPRFQDKLAPLQRHASIDVWDDTKIRPGDDWAVEIDKALQSCKVALLLISDGLLSSKFIAETEFPNLLARHRAGGMRVYPILLKDCMWELDPELARVQIKMADGTQPLETCAADPAKLNAEMTRIAREVLAIIQGK